MQCFFLLNSYSLNWVAKIYPSPLSDVIESIYHGVNIMIEQINTQDLNFGTLVILAPNSTITNKEIRMLSGLKKLSIIRRGYGKNASIVNDILHETLLDAYCILKDIKRY
jgi:hypothetical protein